MDIVILNINDMVSSKLTCHQGWCLCFNHHFCLVKVANFQGHHTISHVYVDSAGVYISMINGNWLRMQIFNC